MKRICIGDLHGDIALYQRIKSRYTEHKLTLMGDLLDSFIYTRTEQRHLLETVLNDIEAGIAECLLGNHELSYLIRRMRCAGYSGSFDSSILPLKSRMWRLLLPFIYDASYDDPILFTHAGLTLPLLSMIAPTGEFDIEGVLRKDLRDFDMSACYGIGMSRGGSERHGGIFWADYFAEFEPIPGLRQVFGHSNVSEIKEQVPGNYNIDCLLNSTKQLLEIEEDGNITIITLT